MYWVCHPSTKDITLSHLRARLKAAVYPARFYVVCKLSAALSAGGGLHVIDFVEGGVSQTRDTGTGGGGGGGCSAAGCTVVVMASACRGACA